jgi:hypothetical protein
LFVVPRKLLTGFVPELPVTSQASGLRTPFASLEAVMLPYWRE